MFSLSAPGPPGHMWRWVRNYPLRWRFSAALDKTIQMFKANDKMEGLGSRCSSFLYSYMSRKKQYEPGRKRGRGGINTLGEKSPLKRGREAGLNSQFLSHSPHEAPKAFRSEDRRPQHQPQVKSLAQGSCPPCEKKPEG